MAHPDEKQPFVQSEPADGSIPIPIAAVPARTRAPLVPRWARILIRVSLVAWVCVVLRQWTMANVDAVLEAHEGQWIASALSGAHTAHPRRHKILFGKKAEQKFL